MKVRDAVAAKLGVAPGDAVFADGMMRAAGRSMPLAEAVGDAGMVGEDSIEYGDVDKQYQHSTFVAHFVEVGVAMDTGLAVPMLMVGIGQGGSLGPLTTSGISGVTSSDAGAASGVVNAAHPLGSALSLGGLVTVSAAGAQELKEASLLVHRVDNAMFGAAILIGVALFVVVLTVCGAAKPLAAVNS